MIRAALLLIFFGLAVGAETLRSRTVTLRVEATEFANLAYQVLCLADELPCSKQTYQQLWQTRLDWNGEDNRQIARLHAILRALPAGYEEPAPLPLNFPSYYPSLVKLHGLKSALLRAIDTRTAEANLAEVVGMEAAGRMTAVVDHFRPRFHTWWRAEGEAFAKNKPKEIARLFKKHALMDLAEQLAEGLAVPAIARRQPHLQLMVRPALGPHSAYGTQLADDVALELPEGDDLAESLGPAVHELFHYFYDSAPRQQHLALLEEFVANPDPAALSFYSYLNEALATAAGLQVEERVLGMETMRKRGRNANYAHPFIGRLGEATADLVRDRLSSGSPLLSGLADAYVRRGRAALGDLAASPRFLLAHHTLQGNRDYMAAFQPLVAAMPAITTVSGADALDRFPRLNAIVLVKPVDLRQAWFERMAGAESVASLRELAAQRFAFVYAQPRAGARITYYFVAETEAELQPLLEVFATSDQPFTGLAHHLRRRDGK